MEILQNIKIALEINGQGQMAPITSREHRNTYSYHVTYISDQYHSSYCARTDTHGVTRTQTMDRTKTILCFAPLRCRAG